MSSSRLIPLAGVDARFSPGTARGPKIHYDRRPTVSYVSHDDKFVRASFERWDSLRVCRGEHYAYPFDPASVPGGARWPHVFVVENSPWLLERYAYESQHYQHTYGFGDNVDEMLTDFDHYLLSFKDDFVEVIAGGIWFERADHALTPGDWLPGHPSLGLAADECAERFEYQGIACELRRNRLPIETLRERARLCAQPLLAFAYTPPGESDPKTAFRLTLRERHGRTACIWRSSMGKELARHEELPDEGLLRRDFESYLDEVLRPKRA